MTYLARPRCRDTVYAVVPTPLENKPFLDLRIYARAVSSRTGLAGVLAALSVMSDLTRGHPSGEAMRACLLATELARRAGNDPAGQSDVFYASLMRFAGCSATSHEAAAALGGDDVAVRARGDLIDATRPAEAARFLAGLGHGADKLRVLARAPRVAGIVTAAARADCEVGADLTQRVGLPDTVGTLHA